jgi:hypothetical protein
VSDGNRQIGSALQAKDQCQRVLDKGTAASLKSMVRHDWPYFGLAAMLNAAAYCAPVSSISAGQRGSEQAADAAVDHYGSEVPDKCGA